MGIFSIAYAQQNGDVRLNDIGDFWQSNGILEVYLSHMWIQVCADNFDGNVASVACRQMGFSSYSPEQKWRNVSDCMYVYILQS